jgi:hypothetical protein
MKIEQVGFAVVSILCASTAVYLRGATGKVAIILVVLGVMFLGPQVFGHDWYQEGYIGGVIIGDFMGQVFSRGEASDQK